MELMLVIVRLFKLLKLPFDGFLFMAQLAMKSEKTDKTSVIFMLEI